MVRRNKNCEFGKGNGECRSLGGGRNILKRICSQFLWKVLMHLLKIAKSVLHSLLKQLALKRFFLHSGPKNNPRT